MGFSAASQQETLYLVAPSYAEHSVFTSLGEIKQPCTRPLSERDLVREFLMDSAFLRGKISPLRRCSAYNRNMDLVNMTTTFDYERMRGQDNRACHKENVGRNWVGLICLTVTATLSRVAESKRRALAFYFSGVKITLNIWIWHVFWISKCREESDVCLYMSSELAK